MFFLLTGRDVHEADTVSEELLAAMTKPAPSLGELAPHLPEPLIHLVDRALAYERTDRWPSARDMQAAARRVHALLASESESKGPPSHRNTVASARPTLVTPSLAPIASTLSSRLRPPRPVVVIAVSAAASFLALVAVRHLGKSFRPGVASATEVAVHASRPDRALAPEEWRTATADPPVSETAATASSGATAPQSPPTPAKASSVRPKTTSRPVEEARVWAASGVRSPAPSLSPERVRAPAPVDPLDRRK
jgi:serine/threonine-protein kinase